jgi:hypothetical protein
MSGTARAMNDRTSTTSGSALAAWEQATPDSPGQRTGRPPGRVVARRDERLVVLAVPEMEIRHAGRPGTSCGLPPTRGGYGQPRMALTTWSATWRAWGSSGCIAGTW